MRSVAHARMNEESSKKSELQGVMLADAFYFHDGTRAKNLHDLVAKLKSIDDEAFSSFVNDRKHDFSEWITFSLKNKKLGEYAEHYRSREALTEFLEGYLAFADSMGRESEVAEEKPSQIKAGLAGSQLAEEESQKLKADVRETAPLPLSKKPLEEIPVRSQNYKVGIEKTNNSLTEQEVEEYSRTMSKVRSEINKVFIGQKDVVDKVVLALVCEAHALLEGVPGLAKSLLVEVLSRVISGTEFKRIQFLPDMLPSDVIGGQIYDPKRGEFKTIKGPIFANFVLADEINRAPPKTHAALMECMQEKKVNIDVEEFILDKPFLVLATQNPLENKGTYALPEAVLDRFMFKLDLKYPEKEHEKVIITENATTEYEIRQKVSPVIDKKYLLYLQSRVKRVYISDAIKDYIIDIVHATRGLNPKIEGIKFIQYGAGPRASIYLGIASKAQALMRGRNYVMPEDIQAVAPDILRHRVCLNFKGKAHNISPDKIVEEILMKVGTI